MLTFFLDFNVLSTYPVNIGPEKAPPRDGEVFASSSLSSYSGKRSRDTIGVVSERVGITRLILRVRKGHPLFMKNQDRERNRRLFVEQREVGDYAVRKPNSERASAVEPTQAEAIKRARELNPGIAPPVERVRYTNRGKPDKWRKP